MIPITVPVTISANRTTIPVTIGASGSTVPITFGYNVTIIGADTYHGSYEFTPSQEAQTIPIENQRAEHDIIINPIPNNYGLITWNGAVLTVS